MAATRDQWKRIPFTSGVPIPFQGAFSREEFGKLREGLVPKSMDDKWFIYFEDPHLFFHRSWTGKPFYRLTLAANSEGASVAEALCTGTAIENSSPEFQASVLTFLIHLRLGRGKPFPPPPRFSQFPNWCGGS